MVEVTETLTATVYKMSRSQPNQESAGDKPIQKLTAAQQRRGNVWTPDMPTPSWYKERPPHPSDTDQEPSDLNYFNNKEIQ